jgi:hypothetical protein
VPKVVRFRSGANAFAGFYDPLPLDQVFHFRLHAVTLDHYDAAARVASRRDHRALGIMDPCGGRSGGLIE